MIPVLTNLKHMKTILLPVDFSEPSNNAVNYAADLSNQQNIERIVLFTHFYKSLFEQIYPSVDFVQCEETDIQQQKEEILKKLENLKTKTLQKLRSGVLVEVILIESPLLRSVLELVDQERPDVLMLGSNSNHQGEESFIGSQMIEITKVSRVPVLIIPPKAHYEPIKNALVACDFKTLNHVSLLQRLHKIKHWPHPHLALLNVDPAQKYLQPNHPTLEIEGIVSQILEDYEYKLYYSDDQDILNGVLDFAEQHQQQMIIALPGIHSFLYSLTHQSITDGLSADATKPVLILK